MSYGYGTDNAVIVLYEFSYLPIITTSARFGNSMVQDEFGALVAADLIQLPTHLSWN